MYLKDLFVNHLKNAPGWKTKKKIVVFSVDDFGNVRLDSKKAGDKLEKSGIKLTSLFDSHDTLESRDDLLALYDVLSAFKDSNGRNAVFTPYAVPCNLNFEKIESNNYKQVFIETLPETYQKLAAYYYSAYDRTWETWKQGIDAGLLHPELHSREHFNYTTLSNRLASNDEELLTILKTRSLTALSDRQNETTYTVSLGFQAFEENTLLSQIIIDGIDKFEKVFGYKPVSFMPPSATMSPIHHNTILSSGIKGIDSYKIKKYQYGKDKFKTELRWTGKKITKDLGRYVVRNCVFEPLQQKNSLNICKQMITAAFTMNSPAIISSHRVNYVGFANEEFRKESMKELRELISWIVTKFPDVSFYSMADLLNDILKSENPDL